MDIETLAQHLFTLGLTFLTLVEEAYPHVQHRFVRQGIIQGTTAELDQIYQSFFDKWPPLKQRELTGIPVENFTSLCNGMSLIIDGLKDVSNISHILEEHTSFSTQATMKLWKCYISLVERHLETFLAAKITQRTQRKISFNQVLSEGDNKN